MTSSFPKLHQTATVPFFFLFFSISVTMMTKVTESLKRVSWGDVAQRSHTHITVRLPAQSTTVHLCAPRHHIAVLVPADGLRRAASSVCSCFIHNQQANLITLWWRAVNFTVSQTLLLPKNWGHPSLIYEAITCNVMKSPSEQDPCHWNNNEL